MASPKVPNVLPPHHALRQVLRTRYDQKLTSVPTHAAESQVGAVHPSGLAVQRNVIS